MLVCVVYAHKEPTMEIINYSILFLEIVPYRLDSRLFESPARLEQSVTRLTQDSEVWSRWSSHILLFSLPLILEGQLSNERTWLLTVDVKQHHNYSSQELKR